MLQSVYGQDNPARGELDLDNLNLDDSKSRVKSISQTVDMQDNAELLGSGLMHMSPTQEREENNYDYTDDEKAKLNKFINFMAGKEEDANGKLQLITNLANIGIILYFQRLIASNRQIAFLNWQFDFHTIITLIANFCTIFRSVVK